MQQGKTMENPYYVSLIFDMGPKSRILLYSIPNLMAVSVKTMEWVSTVNDISSNHQETGMIYRLQNIETWISLEVGHDTRIEATCILKMIIHAHTKQLRFNAVNGIAAIQSVVVHHPSFGEYRIDYPLECSSPLWLVATSMALCETGLSNIWCLIMIFSHIFPSEMASKMP